MRGRLIPLLIGLALCLLGDPARAYVRTRSPNTCVMVAWAQSCIYVQPDSAIELSDLTRAEVEEAIRTAITSWNERLRPSSYMRMRYLPPDGPREVSRVDQLQLIKFRHDSWCRPSASSSSGETCFDPAATAVTTVSFLNKPQDPSLDGRIIDADIDMNAFNYRFYDAAKGRLPSSATDGRTPVDLWNTLSHELGHVLGLEHTCRLDDAPYASCIVTDRGETIPACETVELGRRGDPALQLVYETTMYPTSTSSETSRRLPKADDLAGVVDAYPQGSDPQTCDTPYVVDPVGCASTRPSSAAGVAAIAPLALLGALGLGGLWRLRRRVRRRV
jgi:MYXO-CTERM domain-containing protein